MAILPGFLLTRHWRDAPAGLELVLWAQSPQGPLRLVYPTQRAVCFVPREVPAAATRLAGTPIERRPLSLERLDGGPVDGLYFPRQRDLQRFRAQAAGAGTPLYESDLKPHDRFLMERFVTAGFELALADSPPARPGHLELIAPPLRPADWEPELRALSLDIETDGEAGEVLCVALGSGERELVLMQGRGTDWPSPLPICWLADERALLAALLRQLAEWDPDLILGWNLINFDLDYLAQRCRRHGLPFTLGRGGEPAAVLAPQQPGQARIANIPGRVALDGIEALRAAFWSFDSFELERVAQRLLGRGKLIEHTADKIAEIRRLYREDRAALAAYNLEDTRLVSAIFAKTDLIAFVRRRAIMTGLPLGRTGGSVAAFDHLYLPRLHRAGVVAHDVGGRRFTETSPGGYVMESHPGLYDNVLVLDFKSLYPSIIRTFRIDPLGLARPGDDPVPGFLGARFAREGALLPAIIAELWQRRDAARRAGDRPLAQAIKIIMNSFYGVLGSPGCRFHDPRLAGSITRRGREIITRSRAWIEAQGHQVIYGDTDSLFVLLGSGVDEAAARATGTVLAEGLNAWWVETLRRELRIASHLEIQFETHFLRFLMPTVRGADTGSKKRYAGVVRRGAELELIFKGLESVRSDWTPLARTCQRELYRRVFFSEPWEDWLRELVTRLRAGELDDQLVYRKRLRQALGEYRHSVPPHVQAARLLTRPGRWIEYVITLNGPEPLAARRSPLDYQHYVDRQIAPVADGILHLIGLDFRQVVTSQMGLF
jgi:DNA polymerase II